MVVVMLTIGILADTPRAATGMAVVNHNITTWIARNWGHKVHPIYFARFEAKSGVAPHSQAHKGYEMVPCQGGVWQEGIVQELVERYKVDILYSEDDWWSMLGLIKGAKAMNIPLYFMTPIDSLPIQREAQELFRHCRLVFVPNSSYKYIPNGIHLPHAVDWMTFRQVRPKAFEKFTFLMIGRDERRKALGRAILAFEKIYKKVDCNMVIRANWGATPMSRNTHVYIKNKKLPIVMDRMANCSHEYLANIYSSCHGFICPSKAGACEMSILEAQACALPVLVTDWTFMSENVRHKKTGFLIPISGYDVRGKPKEGGVQGRGRVWGNISVPKLAEKMKWMVENPDRAWRMGVRGMEWVRQYSWEDCADIFMDTILEDYQNLNKER